MAVFKTSKADRSNCETIIFVDQIQSTEEVKVQLYFVYLYTGTCALSCFKKFKTLVDRALCDIKLYAVLKACL